ncbi:family 1 glycosylhydrolase [Cellulomonas sp. URHD0024]|uniref:family 1 glycosylhydrolase n=1 Tax=Cellulomonas sp. URHD0024 TaxID=1302620 RepID=UPI000411EC20|nr:family 1 glycosylhydrolase [Cellulomonas sp. URHD0024]
MHPVERPIGHHALAPLPPVGRTFVGGFESTYSPATGVDALEVTGHVARWSEDVDALLAAGVRHLRYPLRWHRIEAERGQFVWDETDRVLGGLRDRGAVPIVDLVHHTSYPDWLTDGFRDQRFGPAFVRYARAVAERYPWLDAYTLFNEPFATLFLSGHEALWPPYDRGIEGFRRLLLSVLPALCDAATTWRELLPDAHHVWVDTGEHHRGTGPGRAYAELANDRRHAVLDLVLGHDLDPARPFLGRLVHDAGGRLLDLPPLRVDVLGLDYYCHSEWFYDEIGGHAPSPRPVGLANVVQQYWDRYRLPLMLTETNLRGLPSDRAGWLRHTLEQYEVALGRGIPLHGYCWFPQLDSADWDSLLARTAGRPDPVGVVARAADGSRMRTPFTDAWEAAARGVPVAELPAVRFQPPCDAQLEGLLPAMAHWPWTDPTPAQQVHVLRAQLPVDPVHAVTLDTPEEPTMSVSQSAAASSHRPSDPTEPDLVVLSHLRWPWVWQRPQHVVSRLAHTRAASGAHTWFVEEPMTGDVDQPQLHLEAAGPDVTRVVLVVPEASSPVPRSEAYPHDRGFEDPAAQSYGRLLAELVGEPELLPEVWLYTPMALDIALAIPSGLLVYDVMDDLASFKDAPQGLVLRQRRLLAEADVVFTGGPSLHRGILRQRPDGVHLFRSGVDSEHYAQSRELRDAHERPVAGYVGVIDERIDLELVDELARRLPDWTIRLVGPIAKIDPASLPARPNLELPGMKSYDELPGVMAGFDVALMPFALNEATRSISPTKTLEYLAAGLPVVSTRVPDVVDDYATVVRLADDAAGFADACRVLVLDDEHARDVRARPLQARQEWDYIAASMSRLVEGAARSTLGGAAAGERSA